MPRLSPPAAPVDGIHLPTRRQTLGALALLTLLAVALRWPVSVFPELLPLDVNSQHHILMFDGTPPKSLGSACETFRNQVLAWPIWLLSRAAKLVWSPVGAFHVASLVWLVLQGASGWALGHVLGWSTGRRFMVAVALQCNALGLLFLNTGRIEHLVQPMLVLATIGMLHQRHGYGTVLAALGIGLAAHSSPYQAVAGGVLVVSLGLAQGLKHVGRALVASALAAIPVVWTWLGEAPLPTHRFVHFPIGLRELVWDPPAALPSAADLAVPVPVGIADLTSLLPAGPVHFLGAVLVVSGLAGCVLKWREPLARGALLTFVCCTVLALGYELRWTADSDAIVALPWAWIGRGSVLRAMLNTNRFLTGSVFACAVGLGMVADRRLWMALVLTGAVVAESVVLSPGAWPVPASRLASSAVPLDAVPPGPLFLWPEPLWLRSGTADLLSVATGRQVYELGSSACRESTDRWAGMEQARSLRAVLLEVTTLTDKQPMAGQKGVSRTPKPASDAFPNLTSPLAEGTDARVWRVP